MFRDPDFRKNLIVSIVTSVLVLLFIEPILRWVGDVILWLGSNFYEGLSNSIYQSAALGFREKYSFVILVVIVSVLSGAFSGVGMRLLRAPKIAPTTAQSIKRRRILMVALIGFFMLDGLSIIAKDFVELQLNASFNQRITVLSAKVPEQKVRELRASWAMMAKRSDYENLTKEMDSLAEQSHIKLPVALW